MPDPISAGIAGAAGIGSAVANIFGANSAAQAQQQAAQQANAALLQQQQNGLQAQKGYFDTTTAPLASLTSALSSKGLGDYSALEAAIPGLAQPITMDQKTLEQTPGYQFNLSQGLRGVQLGAANLGLSGAQAKAAAQYTTGLADSTYQNQFNNANTNKQNAFNFLYNTAQLGTGAATQAAGQYGALGTSAGNAALGNSATVGTGLSNNLVGAGNAQAAANIATGKNVGNIFTSGATAISGLNNPFGNYGMYGALSSGSAIPGAVGPTSVNGNPLV